MANYQAGDKTVRVTLMVSPAEKSALERMAEMDGGLSEAAEIRRLIRLQAREYGIEIPASKREGERA